MSGRRTPPAGLGFWGRLLYVIERKLARIGKRLRKAYGIYYLRCNGVQVGKRIAVYGALHVNNYGTMSIGDHSSLFGPLYFEVGPGAELRIGSRVVFGQLVNIAAGQSVILEDETLIGPMCHIRDADHAFDNTERMSVGICPGQSAPIVIKRGAWLGANVHVLKGVTIGAGVVIGAGSVVTKDIPDMAIAVGVPAKVIRFRNVSSERGESE